MFKLVVVLIALAGLNQANASSFTFGSCAKSPVISDFSIEKVFYFSFLNFAKEKKKLISVFKLST